MALLPPPLPASSYSSTPSPLITHLPHLSSSQIAALPYPPDVFPGARDVQTSFGSMRVYEWGQEKGRKIIMLHGDATPAPLWKRVATDLVEKGCRVMVIDLWGRGYSSSPNVMHDGRLYGLQILFAASSSPLPWCTETFSIMGFSLGGTIAMEFTASFPHLVRSVALLAPGGLIRELPKVYEDFEEVIRGGVRDEELNGMLAGVLGVEEETETRSENAQSGNETKQVEDNIAATVRWQYHQHQGHCFSFASTLKSGLPKGQHKIWKQACDVLREKQKLRGGKDPLLVICGAQDTVVVPEHIKEDLDKMAGNEGYVYSEVEGGHGYLLDKTACKKVVEILTREWDL